MRYILLFLLSINITICFSQTLNDHRKKYNNSNITASSKKPINTKAQIEIWKAKVDSLQEAKDVADEKNLREINYLNAKIKQYEKIVIAQDSVQIVTDEYIASLEGEIEQKDSIILYQNELIIEYSRPNDISRRDKFTFKNKPYGYKEHILWIDFDTNNQPILTVEKKKDLQFLLEYVFSKKKLELYLVGPKYENINKTYKSNTTGWNVEMNYTSDYYSKNLKNNMLNNYYKIITNNERITIDTDKNMKEKRVSVQIK